MRDHRLIDERSLALHRLVAEKLRADPSFIERACANIHRWLGTCSPNLRPALLEWRMILDGPREALLDLLQCTDERATRLRQSSPFAGILTTAERTRVFQEFARRESNPA